MIADKQIKLIIGSLLHDIGKVAYRSGDGRNHSESGYQYLKAETHISDEEILECIRYHHGIYLRKADISKDSNAYLTYYADNVAAFADRREKDEKEEGFDKSIPLDSVFNILNGNHEKKHYAMQILQPKGDINYPTDDDVSLDDHFYREVIRNITDNLKGIEISEEYLNSLLSVLEANLTYIPSSTSKRELADISLYDHVKMTAAIASCVEQYLLEDGEKDYKKRLLERARQSYDEKMFLLYSMDISGIQKFIYTVGEQGALRGLRARSFYLEIMMEHIVDELLSRVALSRANLIYTGGGHCYILFPNTENVRKLVETYQKELNKWLMDTFGTALYVAGGYAPASANALRNVPEGSYEELYLTISRMISSKKSNRYTAEDIYRLNHRKKRDGERECKVCRRLAQLEGDKCDLCNSLEKMSGHILYKDYFVVTSNPKEGALPLPGDRYLLAGEKSDVLRWMDQIDYVRSYTKNDIYTGKHVATKLWVGSYTTGDTFEKLADKSSGVKRIGILRADVDNLGTTFVRGFRQNDGDNAYVTLSRTAALSRQLSLFFKLYINKILENGNSMLLSDGGARNVTIVYSGGDDVFLAGSWNDVVVAFVDIRSALEKFTQGTLTISGGIGVYPSKYPVNIMAKEVEQLEDASKQADNKNAVTVFSKEHTYSWADFILSVLGEKFQVIDAYFGQAEEHGMAFLYHLTELLREDKDKINFARYVYLLARMEPDEEQEEQHRAAYRKFSKEMYEWSKNAADRRELITAIYLYVYLNREREENE